MSSETIGLYELHNTYNLRAEQLDELVNIFKIGNILNDGLLTRKEVIVALKRAGSSASAKEEERAIDGADLARKGLFTFQQFIELVVALRLDENTLTERNVVEAFRTFSRGDSLDAAELVTLYGTIGMKLSMSEAVTIINLASKDGRADFQSIAKALINYL